MRAWERERVREGTFFIPWDGCDNNNSVLEGSARSASPPPPITRCAAALYYKRMRCA